MAAVPTFPNRSDLPNAVDDPGWPPETKGKKYRGIRVTEHIFDWSWNECPPAQRAALKRWIARQRASSLGFNIAWAVELLRAAAEQVGVPMRAALQDEYNQIFLVEAQNGEATVTEASTDDPTVAALMKKDAKELVPEELVAADFASAGIDKPELPSVYSKWLWKLIRDKRKAENLSYSRAVAELWNEGRELAHAANEDEVEALVEAARESRAKGLVMEALALPVTLLADMQAAGFSSPGQAVRAAVLLREQAGAS